MLEAAKHNNIRIPHFCYLEGVHQIGACRICVVEVEGARTLQASCLVPVREGMVVHTNTAKVRKARKVLYELMLSDHPRDCLSCTRNQNCEFQKLGETDPDRRVPFRGAASKQPRGRSSPSIVRDTSSASSAAAASPSATRCRAWGAERAAARLQNHHRPGGRTAAQRGELRLLRAMHHRVPGGRADGNGCHAAVWRALLDPEKRVIVQTAPAIRAALGEEFGYPPGTLVTGKMASALREMGFDDVFDTNFTADLTIIEEGTNSCSAPTAALTGGQRGAADDHLLLARLDQIHRARVPATASSTSPPANRRT